MDLNLWWRRHPDQHFWMEATLREDIGADLHAPQTGKNSNPYWGYSLVMEVDDGDVVFHYSLERKQIESWSVATGGCWEDDTIWGARGTASRGVEPFKRAGFYRGLHGPFGLPRPLTLAELRSNESTLRTALDAVVATHPGKLYLPFQIRRDGVRAGQGYLFKMPAEVVSAFPKLADAASAAAAIPPPVATPPVPMLPNAVGRTYHPADEDAAISERDPFPVDPAIVERGVRSHAKTQNALAQHVSTLGHVPLLPSKDDPLFDLLWQDGNVLCVAEVKSLTTRNEERQLRLGLGQLLRYRQRLRATGADVNAYLVAEREPKDPGWQKLCDELAVVLVWPAVLGKRVV